MENTNNNSAQAYVTKDFIIDIITRDIGIIDAILELVDNSIDRAVEKYNINVLRSLTEDIGDVKLTTNRDEGVTVNIIINDNTLVIEDNCGGISKIDLKQEVFVFGNPRDDNPHAGLSAFGVGMKRAFFKLGKLIKLRTRTEDEESSIVWDVDEWIAKGDADWYIPFSDSEETSLNFTYNSPGTIISITNLLPIIRTRFSQTSFVTLLRSRLQTSYALFLKTGVTIQLNGETLSHELPNLFISDEINYTSKMLTERDVSIQIIAGVTPYQDRVPRGWYVFCNGRMVLEADKTLLTGWGDGMPGFHPKYNHFVGFASFSSSNVRALPWATTKQGVERDSLVYIVALEEMRVQTLPIINFLDRWKDVRDDDDVAAPALRELLKEGASTSVFASAKNEDRFTYKPKREAPEQIRITFVKDRDIVERVKEALGNSKMKNPTLGEMLFDYYVESELS